MDKNKYYCFKCSKELKIKQDNKTLEVCDCYDKNPTYFYFYQYCDKCGKFTLRRGLKIGNTCCQCKTNKLKETGLFQREDFGLNNKETHRKTIDAQIKNGTGAAGSKEVRQRSRENFSKNRVWENDPNWGTKNKDTWNKTIKARNKNALKKGFKNYNDYQLYIIYIKDKDENEINKINSMEYIDKMKYIRINLFKINFSCDFEFEYLNQNIYNIEEFNKIPGVWAIWNENESICMDVAQTSNIGKEITIYLNRLKSKHSKKYNYNKFDNIRKDCGNKYVIKLIAKNIENKNNRELIESSYVIDNNARYWSPAPGQFVRGGKFKNEIK